MDLLEYFKSLINTTSRSYTTDLESYVTARNPETVEEAERIIQEFFQNSH